MKGPNHNDPMQGVEQRMALLGHELDNVLNGLLGMSQLLRESGLNAEQELWSRAIEHSGRQLRRLVSGFRSGRELAGPQPAARVQSFDGVDLLEQVLLSHAPSALANNNRLLLIVAPAVPRHWTCDPCLLRQLLDNLLGNAIKFTTGGEVLLRVAALRRRAGWLRLTVLDSGPGIDPALGERIFEAGNQGSPLTRGRFGGSGLGLFVCRRAVAALGGRLDWSSSPGGGARFEILLPKVLPEVLPEVLANLLPEMLPDVSPGEQAEAPAGGAAVRSSSILGQLHCRLALSGALLESVAAWLERLGVPWRSGEVAGGQQARAGLVVAVSELPAIAGQPGPTLVLEPLGAGQRPAGARAVAAPILCCTLGPALLGMALEWLWLSDDRPGSVP